MLPLELKPENLRGLQVMYIALAIGVSVFLLVVALLPGPPAASSAGGRDIILVLSIAHVIVFLTAFGVGRFVVESQLRAEKLEELARGKGPEEAGAIILATIRRVSIVRLALLEGAAMFGLAIILLAKFSGVIEDSPEYWLNALSAMLFLAVLFVTFPTKERISALL